ncbi:MAG TPA: nucleotide sugar dehydrogenase [Myxococcales bacterium]|nr:nucleotide sugar dehydrogenase [Myxococcales bacterium]
MPTVAVWGCWHLGTVSAACFAELGHRVVASDLSPEVIAGLRAGRPPIAEPGLAELLRKHLENGRLSFHLPEDPALRGASTVFLAADTDVDEDDRADLGRVRALARAAAGTLAGGELVVVHSQVPVGTTEEIGAEMAAVLGKPLRVAHVPENLRLGKAIDGFLRPDRMVIGAGDAATAAAAEELFAGVDCPRLRMTVRSAEMAKHALNGYLATLVSFSSEVGDLCEATGADAWDVERALRSDRRVSATAPLRPGFGFAGATLGRDVQALRTLASEHSLPSSLMDGVLAVNRRRSARLAERIEAELGGLAGRTICVLGLTYKPGTDTLRRSSSLEIARILGERGARVRAFDPAISALPASAPPIELLQSAEAAAAGADALVIGTEWPEFGKLDWKKLGAGMRRPLVFDVKGLLGAAVDGVELRRVGERA